MNIKIDQDVYEAARYLETHVPTERLVSVAAGLARLAVPLWGHYSCNAIAPPTLTSLSVEQTPTVATR